MSNSVPDSRENLDSDSTRGFVTVIPVDYTRHRGYPQPPDEYRYIKNPISFNVLLLSKNKIIYLIGINRTSIIFMIKLTEIS